MSPFERFSKLANRNESIKCRLHREKKEEKRIDKERERERCGKD